MPTPRMIYMSEELDSAQCKAENLEEERDSLQAENERLRSKLESTVPECEQYETLRAQLATLRRAASDAEDFIDRNLQYGEIDKECRVDLTEALKRLRAATEGSK